MIIQYLFFAYSMSNRVHVNSLPSESSGAQCPIVGGVCDSYSSTSSAMEMMRWEESDQHMTSIG